MVIKAAIYTRVSTSAQEDGTSPETQEHRCREEIARQGWELVGVYYDGGVSGSRSSRPQLDQLRAACLSGEVEVIVANTLDRFTRDEEQWFEFTKNVPVRIVTLDGVDTGTDDRLLSGIRVLIAADERRKIYGRTMSGRLARVEEGHWVGGDPPFGHAVVDAVESENRRRVPRKLVVDEAEAAIVRRAAELLIDELHSTAKTAELLNAEGLLRRPSRYDRNGAARRWDSYTLRKMLKRESLMGRYTWAKLASAKEQPITVSIPAVLDEGRWLELQAVLRKSERRPYVATNVYPLSGRVISTCGNRYVGFTSHPEQGRLMRCTGKKQAPRCGCRQLRARDLEMSVWEAVYELLTDQDRLLALAPGGEEATRDAGVAVKEIARIDALIAQKEKAMTDRAADALVAGVSPDVIAKAVEQIESDLEVLRDQRAEMSSWHTQTAESEARKERLRYFVKLARVLMNPPLEVMHEVFRLLDIEVELVEHDGPPEIKVRGQVTSEAVDQIGRRARDLSGIACSPRTSSFGTSGGTARSRARARSTRTSRGSGRSSSGLRAIASSSTCGGWATSWWTEATGLGFQGWFRRRDSSRRMPASSRKATAGMS